jgi:hypothetical protein
LGSRVIPADAQTSLECQENTLTITMVTFC